MEEYYHLLGGVCVCVCAQSSLLCLTTLIVSFGLHKAFNILCHAQHMVYCLQLCSNNFKFIITYIFVTFLGIFKDILSFWINNCVIRESIRFYKHVYALLLQLQLHLFWLSIEPPILSPSSPPPKY